MPDNAPPPPIPGNGPEIDGSPWLIEPPQEQTTEPNGAAA